MSYLNERDPVTGLFVTPLHSPLDQMSAGINSGTSAGVAMALLNAKAENERMAAFNKTMSDENHAASAKRAGSPSSSTWSPATAGAAHVPAPPPPVAPSRTFPKGVLWAMAVLGFLWMLWGVGSSEGFTRWRVDVFESRYLSARLAKFSDFSKPSEWPAAERAMLAKGPAAGSLEALMLRRVAFPKNPKPADFERLGASVWGLLAPMGASAGEALSSLENLKVKGLDHPRAAAVGMSIMFLQSRCLAGVEPACLDLARFHASKLAGGPKITGSSADEMATRALRGLTSPAAKELAARIGG
jgi:hypothetical protein